MAIDYLKNDLNNLNLELTKEKYKYEVEIDKKNDEIFFKNESGIKIKENDLSPGEKTILLFLIWKYIYSKYQLYGKTILLLDEPDSHFHPQAVSEIVSIIKQLVELGIQVIMTTHNPTTISLIKNESIRLNDWPQSFNR